MFSSNTTRPKTGEFVSFFFNICIYLFAKHLNESKNKCIFPLKVFEEAVRAVLRPEPQKRRQRKCIVM